MHTCDISLAHVWHDSYTCVTWLIHMCDMTHTYVWHDFYICVTWLIYVCDMTHTHVWHESYICMTWLLHMRDVTHMCVWQDSFTYTAWLIHICDMTHIYVRLESYTCVAWLIHTQEKEKRGEREKQNSLFFPSLEKSLSLLEKFSFCPPLENGVSRKGEMKKMSAQEWTKRTLIGHEPLICSKMCFTKTELVQ